MVMNVADERSSLRPGNGYQFHCPVVDRVERFVSCAFRREKHWRGQYTQAQDCHVAMRGGKCPVLLMLKQEWAAKKPLFFDAEATEHKLSPDIIAAVDKIILLPSQGAGFDLTEEQQKRLFGNEHIPGGTPEPKHEPKRRRKAGAAEAKTTDLTEGLGEMKTEMADLINEAKDSVSHE